MEFSFDYFFEHKFVLMTFLTAQRSGPRNRKIVLVSFLIFQMLCFLVLQIFRGPFSFDRIFNAIGIFRSPSVRFLLEIL